MPRRSQEARAPWSAALPLTALDIGLWEEDKVGDRIRGDAVFARMYGLSEAEAAHGISFARLRSIFHPADLERDQALRRRVRETGGLFVWEHRIVPAPAVVHWVLVRGHFDGDGDGRVRGRGIVIDITHLRSEGHVEGPARFLEDRAAGGSILETIADRALELWDLMRDLDDAGLERLRPPLRALLLALGREIAASTPDGADGETPKPRDPKLH